MSAYICSNEHINVIVSSHKISGSKHQFWINDVCHEFTSTQLGQLLTDANTASLVKRYGQQEASTYKHSCCVGHDLKAMDRIKLTQGFRYQACEVDQFDSSMAGMITMKIIDELMSDLPGWDDAKWSI